MAGSGKRTTGKGGAALAAASAAAATAAKYKVVTIPGKQGEVLGYSVFNANGSIVHSSDSAARANAFVASRAKRSATRAGREYGESVAMARRDALAGFYDGIALSSIRNSAEREGVRLARRSR